MIPPLTVASIDNVAFVQLPDVTSGADLIQDDLPTNATFLESPRERDPKALVDSPALPQEARPDVEVPTPVFETKMNGETIKIFSEVPVDPVADYWNNLPVADNGLLDR